MNHAPGLGTGAPLVPAPDTAALPRSVAPGAIRWGVVVIAVAYAVYLAVLVTCDLLRIPNPGFRAGFETGAMLVEDVRPGSIAARAGLQPGDRIVRANDQIVEGATDWQRVRVHLDPAHPLQLGITRAGHSATVQLPLAPGRGADPGAPASGLVTFRLAQIVTLAFAIFVGVRRSSQPSALLGAWLLASIAAVSLVLPMRLAAFWDALPAVIRPLLWLPFATSVAVGPLLFAFFAVFPRTVLSGTTLGLSLLPAIATVGWHVYGGVRIMSPPGNATGVRYWMLWAFLVNVLYAAGGVLILLTRREPAGSATDRRRTRVLLIGTAVGVTAGAAAVARYWWNPWEDVFATRTQTVLSLVFLAMPASFTYAIVRHRLFDVSLIVRQGLRYALARRFVDALIPMLGVVLLADVLIHRAQPLADMLRSRWWWFTLLGAALLVVRARREQWLRGVDRRFFRERYDAQRLLKNIAEQITRASSFDAIAPSVLRQIEEALHPRFVNVLKHVPGELVFESVPAGSAADRGSGPLPASLAVIGVLSVLRKPLALSLGDTAWVQHQLPVEERALLVEHGIELLVPVSSRLSGDLPLALLVLGPRLSDEPYNQEDLDLLVTIAQAVGVLIERSSSDRHTLAECERCGRCFDANAEVCTHDQQPLTRAHGSRLLNDRYRLERRLGRGGMGAVYSASDEVLERVVAVKLIREDVVGPLDLAARFRQEARAAAGFAHPHVVRVYDFGVDRYRRPFLVMELLEGETLRQRLSGGVPLNPRDALQILRGVCLALSAAHGQGLVHRDLKPENIFLQRHAGAIVAKVLDFGLAKAFDARRALERPTGAGTSAGLLVGTLEYMAPEQVAGDEVDPQWDIWAIGVIAYEMLAGHHPFRRTVTFGADGAAVTASTIPASHGPGEMPEAIAAFFNRALSAERARRPADALAFLGACEQVLA